MATTFSYKEERLLSEMIWTPVETNREPDIMLCDRAKRVAADIEQMQKKYGLE